MFRKIFCLILILKLTQARYGFVPTFYGQDSAVIVDTGNTFTQNKNAALKFSKIKMPPPFPIWRHYPRYHIIPPPPASHVLAINSWANSKSAVMSTSPDSPTSTTPMPTTSSATFSSPVLTDEFPAELLDVAQNKLGLKSIEEIPSISELGQLLGTSNSEETLKYMKQLTSNEQGIALVKAYIESADYTDNTADLDNKNDYLENDKEVDDDNQMNDTEEPLKLNDEGLVVISDADASDDYELNNEEEQTDTTLKPTEKPTVMQNPTQLPPDSISFMDRIANYVHLNNLFHKNKDIEHDDYHQLDRFTENGTRVSKKERKQPKDFLENLTESKTTKDHEAKEDSTKTPILVRESIPYNYPVPIRIQTSTTSTLPPSPNSHVVHLNTPKFLIPNVQQLSRITKIPSKDIEDFLATKPKLLELATKVSRFPIGYHHNSPMEAQVLATVKKAFEQDDDLKNLWTSRATLK